MMTLYTDTFGQSASIIFTNAWFCFSAQFRDRVRLVLLCYVDCTNGKYANGDTQENKRDERP